MGGVNSNGVVPTLLDRAGGWSTFDFGGTIGGSRHIPDYHFAPTADGVAPVGTYYRDIANWAWRLANPTYGNQPR
ncbi:MAG: hypothetical protein HZA24_12020 [Nitrospirae bacterium]|nr:hypothetical protein [Nitrospirota bacterium]